MHVRRRLTTALLVVATSCLLASPAAAAPPEERGRGVHAVRVVCTGDTVRISAVVRGQRDVGAATVTLQARQRGVWSAVAPRLVVARTKPGRNTWTLDASRLGPGVTDVRAEIRAAGGTVLTAAVPMSSCAPGTEVPEVPVAALLPLTLAATAAGVLAVRGRRPSCPA